jgi:hypothetical protein
MMIMLHLKKKRLCVWNRISSKYLICWATWVWGRLWRRHPRMTGLSPPGSHNVKLAPDHPGRQSRPTLQLFSRRSLRGEGEGEGVPSRHSLHRNQPHPGRRRHVRRLLRHRKTRRRLAQLRRPRRRLARPRSPRTKRKIYNKHL